MKKILLAIVVVGLVSGCGKMDNNIEKGYFNKNDFAVVCLDGVEYYMRSVDNKGYMAVKIDKETRLPGLCED